MVFTTLGGGNPFETPLEAKAALFDAQIAPATQMPATRQGYWAAWRSFVTFMLIQGAVDQAFPATETAIKGFAMQLLMVGYAGASLTRFFEAILDRHRQHGASIGVCESRLRAWLTAMQKGLGMPKRDKFFILPMHIRCALQLPRDTLKHLRDVTMVVVGTVCALRCGELARLDTCDLLWDFDGVGTLAVLLWYRKNDGLKRGLFPRIGKGSTPGTCPLLLIREYVQRGRLQVSKQCTKKIWRRSACNACGRLFRNTTAGGARLADSGEGTLVNASVIDAAVKETLARVGVVPDKYSPVSMRRGGVSAALAAGVNETLWKLQSGHRSISWQNYADVVTRDQLYEFSNAFGL
jgi:hypothetical protein